MSWAETRNFLSIVRALLKVEPVTIEMHQAGVDLAERYGLSVYGAMIASAALLADCDTLFSEDLQNGLLVNGRLRVVNPF
jgi:predicted nucleic acid-binding protein